MCGCSQPRGQVDLALEALGADPRRKIRMENLQGDRTVVLHVGREVDGGHTPAPEFPLDPVVPETPCQERI